MSEALADPGTSFVAIVESAARAAATLAGEITAAFAMPSGGLDAPAVLGAQSVLRPLLLGLLTAGVLVQCIRVVLLRRGEPIAAVAAGLARFTVTAALGVVLLQAALVAGDTTAAALLGGDGGAAGDVGALVAGLLQERDGLTEPFLLLLTSVCVIVLAGALWMTLVLRQIALLVIAAALPLAAAGSLTASTRVWLVRMTPWAVALVLCKPAAALVLAVGAEWLRSPAAPGGVGATLAAIVVLGLAAAVLPALTRLLSWTTVRVSGQGSRAPERVAVGALRLTGPARAASAVALAGFLEHSGPGTAGARPAPVTRPVAGPPPGARVTARPPQAARPRGGAQAAAVAR